MRQDYDRYSVVFITPNGFRWYVEKDSPFIQWLSATLRSKAKEEEEYVIR